MAFISLSLFQLVGILTFLKTTYAESSLNVVAVGDWGCSSNAEETVSNAKSRNPQLVLALGDYSYSDTSDCWFNLTKPIDSVTKINIGNHDDMNQTMLSSYMNHYGLSKQYYSFDVGNIHILTMSNGERSGPKSEQYDFVVDDLKSASNNPSIKWIIVNMHSPFYTSPNNCEESECSGNADFREIYHVIFDQYGVDMVLQGHIHNYQRSFPLKYNSTSSDSPRVTSFNQSNYMNPDGEIFAIVGTGGENLHSLSGKSAFTANQQDSRFGILNIHFSDNQLEAKFLANDGLILDEFNVSKIKKGTSSNLDQLKTSNNIDETSEKTEKATNSGTANKSLDLVPQKLEPEKESKKQQRHEAVDSENQSLNHEQIEESHKSVPIVDDNHSRKNNNDIHIEPLDQLHKDIDSSDNPIENYHTNTEEKDLPINHGDFGMKKTDKEQDNVKDPFASLDERG